MARNTIPQRIEEIPIAEIAALDYIKNPARSGSGGIYRGSSTFEVLLKYTATKGSTEEIYRLYDNAWIAAHLKDNFQPKIAILQYREGVENTDRRFVGIEGLKAMLKEEPDCNNYELIYVRKEEETAETEAEKNYLMTRLYTEFNADILRPWNYYGHSLSEGDVIVIVNDFSNQSAYFVDDFGFVALPKTFLSSEMSAKIYNDLDIRQESILYGNIRIYETEKGISICDAAMQKRHNNILSGYSHIFEMAERRKLAEKENQYIKPAGLRMADSIKAPIMEDDSYLMP